MPRSFLEAIRDGWVPLFRFRFPIVISCYSWEVNVDLWRSQLVVEIDLPTMSVVVQPPITFVNWYHRYHYLSSPYLREIPRVEQALGKGRETPIPYETPPADDPWSDF